MILIPYKADVDLHRLPVLTLLVCLVCIWVFARQTMSQHAYSAALDKFCTQEVTSDERLVMRYLDVPSDLRYCDVLMTIRNAPKGDALIRELADRARPTPFYRNKADSAEYIHHSLTESSRRFELSVPKNLTDKLHFDPNHPTFGTTITSAFSHGSWWHLASNLVFFFAFAASVEVIAGYFYFVCFIVLSAVGTDLAYVHSVRGMEASLPTIGLSGVVMTMMALLATIMPRLKIRCFFWFLVFIRTFRVPALAIAGLYIAENIYDYLQRDPQSEINYIAHISGAAIGVVMGLAYRWRYSDSLQELG